MCNLWDMTIEKDVVLFLLKHDFIKLATCLLQLPDLEPRFLEIIVGILHNMCCVEELRKVLCDMPETTSCLMDTLSSNDSLTLVQAVRLLNTVAWDVVHQVEERDPSPHWLVRAVDDLQLSKRLAYILLSSTRPELLCCALDLMNTLCVHAPSFSDKDFSRYFANEDIAFGLLAAWRQLLRGGGAAHADVPAKALRKAGDQWAAVLSAFSGHEQGKAVLCLNAEKITSIINTTLQLSEDNEDMLRDSVAVLEAIIPSGSDIPTILPKLLKISHELDRKPKNDDAMSEDSENLTLREALENYFESLMIHVGSKSTMESNLSQCDENLKQLFWTIIERRDPELLQERVEPIVVGDVECNQHSI
ncbi:hypothetical protein LSTR_LSTR008973 [Laodelphax striatellus]|uniref:Protein SAAL1 n=1 Tax=Laodelphax striatellus TaxID=195883 RepID=A0A482WKK4_LAOST|nr:hypothetical protein LSTR_LSTR008973 [Laodelphax striatellus]